jgi:hypothetical protein
MADPSPATVPPGLEPVPPEGQAPDDPGTDPQAGEARTYPEEYVKQLRRESAGFRTRLAELEEQLAEREEADKTEVEKLTTRVTDAEKRAADAETRLIRYEVAAERGLDLSAAAFLSGSTREEIEHRAEELAKLLDEKAPPKPAASFDGGARTPAPDHQSPEEAHNALLLDALGRGRRAP